MLSGERGKCILASRMSEKKSVFEHPAFEWLEHGSNLYGFIGGTIGFLAFLYLLIGQPHGAIFYVGVGVVLMAVMYVVFLLAIKGQHSPQQESIAELMRDGQSMEMLPQATLSPIKEPEQVNYQELIQTLKRDFELVKLEPNLIQLGGDDTFAAYDDENGVIVVGERDTSNTFEVKAVSYGNQSDRKPVIVKGKRQPIRKVAPLHNVYARLTYKFFDGRYPLIIHRGAWLSEQKSIVDFPSNCSPRRLILATVEGEKENPIIYVTRRDFDSSYKGAITKREQLNGDLFNVIVELYTELESEVIKKFEYIIEITREPEFEVKHVNASLWKSLRLSEFYSEGLQLSIRIYQEKKEEEIVEEIKDWEVKVANFIGQHLSEHQKTSFLNSYPSIEAGLNHQRRMPLLLPRSPAKEPQEKKLTLPYYTLNDSIEARTDKLEQFIKDLYRP